MAEKSELFEEGYGKGWLYKGSQFVDFVFYHYQIFQFISTTRIRTGKKTGHYKYRLSGTLKLDKFGGNLYDEDFLLLVTKEKGFDIHVDHSEDAPKSFHFVQNKSGEPQKNAA